MLAEKVENPVATEAAHRAKFFRQSGWLMVANIGGGFLMWGVHLLNKALPPGQYGSFGAFLTVVMLVPTIPLQMIMTQQTAKALANDRRGELSGLIRFVWIGTFVLWALCAGALLLWQNEILAALNMTDVVGLWVTAFVVLLYFWMPMFWGALQGEQNFLWLGWSMLSNGIGRITVSAVAVLLFHAYAAGMMGGVLVGVILASAIGGWQTRRLWLTPPKAFDWRSLLRQVTPLLLGFLGFQILFTADTQTLLCGRDGRFLSQRRHDVARVDVAGAAFGNCHVSPVGPQRRQVRKIQSARVGAPRDSDPRRGGRPRAMAGRALCGETGLLGQLCEGGHGHPAVVCRRHDSARPDSKLGLALCVMAVALGYMFALTRFHDSLVTVLQTLVLFNVALLAVCAWFTWGTKVGSPQSTVQSPDSTF